MPIILAPFKYKIFFKYAQRIKQFPIFKFSIPILNSLNQNTNLFSQCTTKADGNSSKGCLRRDFRPVPSFRFMRILHIFSFSSSFEKQQKWLGPPLFLLIQQLFPRIRPPAPVSVFPSHWWSNFHCATFMTLAATGFDFYRMQIVL